MLPPRQAVPLASNSTGPVIDDAPASSGGESTRTAVRVRPASGLRVLGRSAQGVAPVEGALVFLSPRDPETMQLDPVVPVATGPEGIADVGRMTPGRWRARVVAAGFLGAEKDFEMPVSDGAGALPEFVLDALASLHGVVRTKEGSPVRDATVEVLFPSEASAWFRRLAPEDGLAWAAETMSSGEGGIFRRTVLPPGLPLQVRFEQLGTGQLLLSLGPLAPGEARELSVVLNRPTGLVGGVESVGSVGGEEVVIVSRVVDGGRGLLEEARTDPSPDGRFAFFDISPGPKLLQYTRREPSMFGVGCLEATAVEEETVDVGTIVVRPSVLTLLAVIADDPRVRRTVEVRGAVVQGDSSLRQFPFRLRLETGAPVPVVGLPVGLLGLAAVVQREGGAGADRDFPVARLRRPLDGASAGEVLAFRPRTRTSTLLLRASPPPGILPERFDARLALLRDGRFVRGSPAPWQGIHEITFKLEPAKYEVWAVANGFVAGPIPVEVEDGGEASLSIDVWRPSAIVRGRVVTANGEPVERVAVHVAAGPQAPGDRSEPLILEWTDDAGRFVLPGLPSLPDLTLRAFAPGRSSRALPLAGEAQPSDSLELILEPDR